MLYGLRKADFYEIRRLNNSNGLTYEVYFDRDRGSKAGRKDNIRWEKAKIVFNMLKAKVFRTPILNHFEPERSPVIVVYASK